ncbi:hypothetical protein SLEP1_g18997 [Rubroshorea leprosula]|nr:hypothetical protein SLEP1_g18997 [Rubroshorea leprosula]
MISSEPCALVGPVSRVCGTLARGSGRLKVCTCSSCSALLSSSLSSAQLFLYSVPRSSASGFVVRGQEGKRLHGSQQKRKSGCRDARRGVGEIMKGKKVRWGYCNGTWRIN